MGLWNKPPGGLTQDQLIHRRRQLIHVQIAVVVVSTLAVGAVAGYRWVSTVAPVDQEHAPGLFRAQRQAVAADRSGNERRTPEAERRDRRVVLESRPRADRASPAPTETVREARGEDPRSSRRHSA